MFDNDWFGTKKMKQCRRAVLGAIAAYVLLVNWRLLVVPHTTDSLKSLRQTDWMQGHDLYRPYTELPTMWIDGVPGYNLFRNLYLWKGTFYAIAADEKDLPSKASLLSLRPDNQTGKREPADDSKFKVLSLDEARSLFGERTSIRLGGTTIFFNDEESGPPRNMSSFLDHYFHLAESFVGAWRLLVKVQADESGSKSVSGITYPSRILFGHAEPKQWRDHAGLSTWFLSTILPMTAVEEHTVFQDRAKSESLHVFDQIILLDRFSASRTSPLARAWNKMAAELPNIPAPGDWWDPIRSNLFHAIGSPELLQKRASHHKAVVTYVSRQTAAHRRMFPADDAQVVAALHKMADNNEIEFVHAIMEKMDRPDQFRLAARTDVLIGIHGNGLSHQMWQRPGSVVVEIMDAGGFTRDYEILSELMGHTHYTVHNDVLFKRSQWYVNEAKWQTVCDGAFVSTLVRDIVASKGY